MIDSLKYSKQLEEAGFTRAQAEANIGVLMDVIRNELATKQDIDKILHRFDLLESKLTNKFGGMLIAAVITTITLIVTLQKLV